MLDCCLQIALTLRPYFRFLFARPVLFFSTLACAKLCLAFQRRLHFLLVQNPIRRSGLSCRTLLFFCLSRLQLCRLLKRCSVGNHRPRPLASPNCAYRLLLSLARFIPSRIISLSRPLHGRPARRSLCTQTLLKLLFAQSRTLRLQFLGWIRLAHGITPDARGVVASSTAVRA